MNRTKIKKLAATIGLVAVVILTSASDCGGGSTGSNYDRWCYAVNCDGRADKRGK